jgi:hypothetical protein
MLCIWYSLLYIRKLLDSVTGNTQSTVVEGRLVGIAFFTDPDETPLYLYEVQYEIHWTWLDSFDAIPAISFSI